MSRLRQKTEPQDFLQNSMNFIYRFRSLLIFMGMLCAFVSIKGWGVIINRVNGGMSIVYVDFNLSGDVVPLEMTRTYNSITAISETNGWAGAFGWGWTSDFESRITVTPERNVLLRDGETGNNVLFRPVKEDPKAISRFIDKVRVAYEEKNSKSGKKITLPKKIISDLQMDPEYRKEMAQRYDVKGDIPQGGLLVSTAYGYDTIFFKYDEWHRAKDGVTHVFDKEGRLTKRKDKNGYFVDFKYDPANKYQLREIVGRNQSASLRFLWRNKHVVRITDNKGERSSYEYDSKGNLVKVTDSKKQVYGFSYEKKGLPHLLTKISYLSEKKNKTVPSREFDYDKNGLLTFHKEKDGLETRFVYGRSSDDPQNNFWTRLLFKNKKSTFEPDERYEEYTLKKRDDGSKYLYRSLARNIYKSGNAGKSGRTEEELTIYTACCGKPLQITKNGVTTKFKYYENGLLKEKSGPKIDLALEYDPRWGKVSQVRKNGKLSKYEYDNKGNLVKATSSLNEKIVLQYDPLGRISQMIDGKGKMIEFKYGAIGRPVQISQKGTGTIVIKYGRDGSIAKTETYLASTGQRAPTGQKSQQVVREVMGGFQYLLDVIRPAAEVNKDSSIGLGGL